MIEMALKYNSGQLHVIKIASVKHFLKILGLNFNPFYNRDIRINLKNLTVLENTNLLPPIFTLITYLLDTLK